MQLKLLLPFKILIEQHAVLKIVLETTRGCFAILPHRLDCVAALVPGILTYQTANDGDQWVAVDAGILVKTGPLVLVSVRRALVSADLALLQHKVEQDYQSLNDEQQTLRSVMAKLENGFLQHFAHFDKK